MPAPVRLEASMQAYPWGSTTAIPRLLGVPPTGQPQAELWIGAHPKAPSRVLPDGPTLDAYLAAHADRRLGPEVQRRHGELPFLLKYLAAAEPLSVQCHPNATQARAGFAREEAAGIPRDARERSYRDANPKPELIVARGRFEALRGFRPIPEIQALLEALGVPALRPVLDALEAPGGGLEEAYTRLMTLPADAQAVLAQAVVQACLPKREVRSEYDWVVRLADKYPGDVGVVSPLLLNHVVLAPGEAMYLDAGVLHAYLQGEGIEIMANSDNVVRGGLTPKHVDVPELIRLLRFEPEAPRILQPTARRPGLSRYETPAEHFALDLVRPDGAPVDVRTGPGPHVLLGLEGYLSLETDAGDALDLAAGQAVFVPMAAGGYRIGGSGEAALAHVP